MKCLLSFIFSLCLTQGSFPIFFAHDKKTDSRVTRNFVPFIVDIDIIIDIYVQHVGSSVLHKVEPWGFIQDLLHLFNATLVIHNLTPSIWSDHNHRAVAAAFVRRQNCPFCVSDLKN